MDRSHIFSTLSNSLAFSSSHVPSLIFLRVYLLKFSSPRFSSLCLLGQMMMFIYVCLQCLIVRKPFLIILHTPSSCNLLSKSIILPRRYRPYSSSSCTLSHPMLRAFKFLRPVWLMGLSNFSAYSFATPVT